MLQFGLVAVALGIIALIFGIFQKVKAGRVAGAPLVKTGDASANGAAVAGPKGAISAQGAVACPQPLVSPVSGTTCLFYELKCTASWKDGDTQKTREICHEKVAAAFTIDDGSGPVRIDARAGGDFEPTQKKEETKGTGLIGGITGQDIVFGNYRVSPGMLSLGTKYTVEESVFPVEPKLYACGKTEGGAIAAPGWRSLILTSKTRDELLSHATRSAKMALIGGAAVFAVGMGLSIVGQRMDDGEKKAAAVASASATATAAATGDPAASAAADPTGSAPAAHPAKTSGKAPTAAKAPIAKAPAKNKK